MHRSRQNGRRHAWWAPALFLVFSAGQHVLPVFAQSPDERFLAGLRDRGLYRLGVAYCLDRLDNESLAPPDRARFAVELSRCHATHAMNVSPAEQGPIWDSAAAAVGELAGADPRNPHVLLVRLQEALVLLARGELARQQVEVGVATPGGLDAAREHLRAAVRLLERLNDDSAEALRESHRPAVDDSDRLSPEQLTALTSNVRFQLARALRNQALCYPIGSADRVNSLARASEQLEPLEALSATTELMWRARLDQIACRRLLGDFAAATRKLDALDDAQPTVPIQLAARAERIRLDLVQDRLEEALTTIRKGRSIGSHAAPDLDLAIAETFVALWRDADGRDDRRRSADWQFKAVDAVRLIEQQHGAYWHRRAEGLLAATAAAGAGAGNLDVLVHAAQDAFHRDRPDEAVVAYDRAAEKALELEDADRAYELFCAAALIEDRREHHEAAMRRFARLAERLPRNARAAEAHWGAVLSALRLARQDAAKTDGYATLLAEHVNRFPDSETADRARWWLGRLHEGRRQWPEAIAAYRGISAQFAQLPDAIAATERCYRAQLNALQAAGQATDGLAGEAARHFESLTRDDAGRTLRTWTPAGRAAALAAARTWLDWTDGNQRQAADLLAAASDDAGDAADQWQSAARALSVVAAAAGGRPDQAEAILKELSGGQPGPLLDMLAGLARTMRSSRPESARSVAGLILRGVALIGTDADTLDPAERMALDRLHAEALAVAGRHGEAVERLEQLIAKHPDDGDLSEQLAETLSAGQDRAMLEAALGQWRAIVQRSPPESQRWYRAKLAIARAHFQLGDKQRAAEVVRVLQALHPDLGGAELRHQFLALLAACRR